MTTLSSTFSISDYELYGYTNSWVTPDQLSTIQEVESRVQGQLDFLAQLLGWSGPEYWTNLPNSANQKRQLLGGTFGVYNSYVIIRVYEVRNWNETIVVERTPFLTPGRVNEIRRIKVGDNDYAVQGVTTEGDKYVVSVGSLPDQFYADIEAGLPVQVDIPTYRPAPFYRAEIGVSGNASFVCSSENDALVLYPGYDTQKKFPVRYPYLYRNGVYTFNQPVYISYDATALTPDISVRYDDVAENWVLDLRNVADLPITSFLVLANQNSDPALNPYLEISVLDWVDPSDWGLPNVLDNFKGVWNNKGGDLAFNFVFDALSIHGFNEAESVFLGPVERSLGFNDIVNYVYSQKTVISPDGPPAPEIGDLWWNDNTGALSVWYPSDSGCGSWVEIDYRQSPNLISAPTLIYPDVPTFRAAVTAGLNPGDIVRIDDITGLDLSDNVIGVQGSLNGPATLTLYLDPGGTYWVPVEFSYADALSFSGDAALLPYQIPVRILDGTGLTPTGPAYSISNLAFTVTGQYEVLVQKFYTNDNWELFPNSLLKYIAFSSLFGGPTQEGGMWWDFANTDPDTRAAAIYYQSAWVAVNSHPQSGPPAPVFDDGVLLFYADGHLLTEGLDYITDNYIISYTWNNVSGNYDFTYTPRNFLGSAQLPTVTMSDNLTSAYQADVSPLVFSGLTYQMSANVLNSESPLRVWKAQALQCVDSVNLLSQEIYINPLRADENTGPGDNDWERYFIRLPLEYGRNGEEWQKVALICQDFGYWGSSIAPESMRCPPEDDLPAIYEELFLYGEEVPDYTYIYSEPYLYSNVAFFTTSATGDYDQTGVFPASDFEFDEFQEASFTDYAPLHNRQAYLDLPVGAGYGDWKGDYVNVNPCIPLTGHLETDLLNQSVEPVAAPIWDASIYKAPPTCQNDPQSYKVDANNYKVCYAYFVADASAAEDPFFDISQEPAWRYPVTLPRTSYLTPR